MFRKSERSDREALVGGTWFQSGKDVRFGAEADTASLVFDTIVSIRPEAADAGIQVHGFLNRLQTIMFLSKNRIWLAFTPFVVALALVLVLMLYPFTGIGPTSNIYALCALAAIVLGLVVGIISLFREKTIRVWWRLLMAMSPLSVEFLRMDEV